MERAHQVRGPCVLLSPLGRLNLHGFQDGLLGPPLREVRDAGKELEQPHARGAPDGAPDGGEIEGLGHGEGPVEIEEDGRDSERSWLHGLHGLHDVSLVLVRPALALALPEHEC